MRKLVIFLPLLLSCCAEGAEPGYAPFSEVCGKAPIQPKAPDHVDFDTNHAILYRTDFVEMMTYQINVAQWSECAEAYTKSKRKRKCRGRMAWTDDGNAWQCTHCNKTFPRSRMNPYPDTTHYVTKS